MERPPLTPQVSLQDFRDFYWLKEELVVFCRAQALSSRGGKLEIAKRIEQFLGKEKISPEIIKNKKLVSSFDWNVEELSLETIITDSYKNTEQVRRFFEQQLGRKFHFSVPFMNWMKKNVGSTLETALIVWKEFEVAKKSGKKTDIDPQFEYNRYIRDFMTNNPGVTLKTARRVWLAKRKLRGSKSYSPDDLCNLLHSD